MIAISWPYNLFTIDCIIFSLGTCVGSFLNSVIYRLNKRESFLFSRSYCPHCGHKLSWWELIPLFSFIYLKGRCRYCQEKISLQYPLVELFSGILFTLSFHSILSHFEIFPSLLYFLIFLFFHWFFISLLIIIFIYDLKHYVIPDKIIYPGIFGALIFNFAQDFLVNGAMEQWSNSAFIKNFIASLIGGLFFLFIYLVSKGSWMGFGDVKLAFLLGLFLGFPKILICFSLGFFLGALVGTILILVGKKSLKSKVPLAPFLITGAFLLLFWGENLVSFWRRIFLI